MKKVDNFYTASFSIQTAEQVFMWTYILVIFCLGVVMLCVSQYSGVMLVVVTVAIGVVHITGANTRRRFGRIGPGISPVTIIIQGQIVARAVEVIFVGDKPRLYYSYIEPNNTLVLKKNQGEWKIVWSNTRDHRYFEIQQNPRGCVIVTKKTPEPYVLLEDV